MLMVFSEVNMEWAYLEHIHSQVKYITKYIIQLILCINFLIDSVGILPGIFPSNRDDF